MSFVVRRQFRVEVGGVAHPVVWAKRIDRLNFNVTRLALWARGYEQILLPIEANEATFLRGFLVAAVLDGKLGVDTRASRAAADGLGQKVTPVVVNEVLTNSGLDQDTAKTIATQVRRRAKALALLRSKGYRLYTDGTLQMSPALVEDLSDVKDPDAYEVVRAAGQLNSYQGAVDSALELTLKLIQLEFVARQVELERLKDKNIELPEGFGEDTAIKRAIISAELLKLSVEEKSPRLAMWRTTELAFNTHLGIAESNGAAAALSAIADNLGALPDGAWASAGTRNAKRLASIVETLFDRPPAEIRKAAAGAYQTLFKQPPPQISVVELNAAEK